MSWPSAIVAFVAATPGEVGQPAEGFLVALRKHKIVDLSQFHQADACKRRFDGSLPRNRRIRKRPRGRGVRVTCTRKLAQEVILNGEWPNDVPRPQVRQSASNNSIENGYAMREDRPEHVPLPRHKVERYPTGAGVIEALVAGEPRPEVPMVVIVAGLGAVAMMRRTMTATALWTRSVLLDLPGYHHNGPDSCPPAVEDIADLVVVWLREYAAAPVVLVGHSTGAQAALHAAAEVPHLVEALVLAGPTLVPAARRPWGLARKLVRTLMHESASAGMAVAPDLARAGARNLLRFARSGMNDRPEEVLRRIVCPALIVTGVHDHLAPAGWARELAAIAEDGRVVTLPAAHSFPHTMPQALSDLIQQSTGRFVTPAQV